MSELIGVVVKESSSQTVKVRIERSFTHPLYKKRIKLFSNFTAHDVLGVKVGDTVRIKESRPISKTKRHVVISKVK